LQQKTDDQSHSHGSEPNSFCAHSRSAVLSHFFFLAPFAFSVLRRHRGEEKKSCFLLLPAQQPGPGFSFFSLFLLTKWGAFRVYVIQVNEYEEQQQVNWLILVEKKERKEKKNARERAHCKRRRKKKKKC
jgi:hypothetical protein